MSELLDNTRYRLDRLKSMIRRLHDGEDPEALKEEFAEILREVGPSEISALETQLMDEGMPQQEIQRMCDVHAAVFRDSQGGAPDVAGIPGHPANTLVRENERIRDLVAEYRTLLDDLAASGDRPSPAAVEALSRVHAELAKVHHHYERKELLFFPFLEKAGITGPPKVMWGVDDEIRELVKAAGELLPGLANLSPGELALARETVFDPMLEQVESMTDKEDRILLPMLAEHLSQGDWFEIAQQWKDLGPMIAPPAGAWLPILNVTPQRTADLPRDEAIRLPSGNLTVEQLAAMLNTLPFDITFVDANDRVAYFSEGPERVFARSRTIIGRRVQDCHPPKSLHIVEQVVEELRSRKREVAEFWIQSGGKFIHIRYFPVWSPSGEYLGTLEVTQDVTGVRALEGERRLLDEIPSGREEA